MCVCACLVGGDDRQVLRHRARATIMFVWTVYVCGGVRVVASRGGQCVECEGLGWAERQALRVFVGACVGVDHVSITEGLGVGKSPVTLSVECERVEENGRPLRRRAARALVGPTVGACDTYVRIGCIPARRRDIAQRLRPCQLFHVATVVLRRHVQRVEQQRQQERKGEGHQPQRAQQRRR